MADKELAAKFGRVTKEMKETITSVNQEAANLMGYAEGFGKISNWMKDLVATARAAQAAEANAPKNSVPANRSSKS